MGISDEGIDSQNLAGGYSRISPALPAKADNNQSAQIPPRRQNPYQTSRLKERDFLLEPRTPTYTRFKLKWKHRYSTIEVNFSL